MTKEEVEFCRILSLTAGFDIDDQQPQESHLCWPHITHLGALCGSSRLWFSGACLEDTIPSCKNCLQELTELGGANPELIRLLGVMSGTIEKLFLLFGPIDELLYCLEYPQKAAELLGHNNPLADARIRLEKAVSHACGIGQ